MGRFSEIFSAEAVRAKRGSASTQVAVKPQSVNGYDDEAFERDRLYRMCLDRGGEALRLAEIVREIDDAWFAGQDAYKARKRELGAEARQIAARLASERVLEGAALRAKALEVFADDIPAPQLAVVAVSKPQPAVETPTGQQGGLF